MKGSTVAHKGNLVDPDVRDLKGSAVAPMGNIVDPDVRDLKGSAVAPKGNIVDPAEDPMWELASSITCTSWRRMTRSQS